MFVSAANGAATSELRSALLALGEAYPTIISRTCHFPEMKDAKFLYNSCPRELYSPSLCLILPSFYLFYAHLKVKVYLNVGAPRRHH